MRTMSGGMKLLLLSMLVSLCRVRGCPDRSACACQMIGYWERTIQCPSDTNPKFIVRSNIFAQKHRIECRDATPWSEFGYHTVRSTKPTAWTADLQLHDFTIERCALPDESFHELAERLGSQSVRNLAFTSHMNLSSALNRRYFSMLHNLRGLNLSSNGLTELPSDLFRDLTNLGQLDLSFNMIAVLPPDIFQGLQLLQRLYLSYNAIKFFDRRLLSNCKILNKLSLRENLLTRLDPLDFHRFRNLSRNYENLVFEPFVLESLDDDSDVNKVLRLDISGNRFLTLPEELFSQVELAELTLSHNHGNLTTLPRSFLSNSTHLKRVIIIQNNLASLPENIFWYSFSVRSIDLHGNALTTLPKDIFRDSRALLSLDLSENRLNYLPEGLFGALSDLQDLNLARNGIHQLQENIFENLDSLLKLNLEVNSLTNIHPTAFRKLPKIQIIRLSHNFISLEGRVLKQPGEYFSPSTIQVFLDHNKLRGHMTINKFVYDFNSNIQFVDLSYNQFFHIEASSSWIRLKNIEYDFRHNNISTLQIFDGKFPKVSILVDDNPLYCGCELYFSLSYVREIRKQQSDRNIELIAGNASCSEPNWMKGTPIASLQLETFTCRSRYDDRIVLCTEACTCWWRPNDQTRIINCSRGNFSEMPDKIIEYTNGSTDRKDATFNVYAVYQIQWNDWNITNVELDLANNSLTEIPTLDGTGNEHVVSLVLSHNNISRLTFEVLPSRLKILRLDHNDLRTLNATTVKAMLNSRSLSELDLRGNPWDCDAETRNRLAALGEKFGENVRYSFDKRTCLDSRQPTSSGEIERLYITFDRF